ncbi:unnamed protein product [Pylaiella littoralis]
MDVYDRDELLRAVSLQGKASGDPTAKHPAIRIFVRREDSGIMTVFINDTVGEGEVGWRRYLRRGGPAVVDDRAIDADADAEAAQADDRFGGALVPEDGTVSLGGIRTRAMTPARGRDSIAPRPKDAGALGPQVYRAKSFRHELAWERLSRRSEGGELASRQSVMFQGGGRGISIAGQRLVVVMGTIITFFLGGALGCL